MAKDIRLTEDTNKADIDALCEWLKTYPKLTKDKLTLELETKFAQAVGAKYSVFVNSGSSANLLMLSALKEVGHLKVGDKVGVPALCWSTDLAPIIQLGLVPVILDCSEYHLGIETAYLSSIIEEFDIKCILSVSVLGIPPEMDHIAHICKQHGVILLEDNCESLGSKYNDVDLGIYGTMASWSTYFSHHISTIEGGFVTCHHPVLKNLLNSIRSHGWKRDQHLHSSNTTSNFYFPYTFFHLGYNIRNTEIGAFLGLRQVSNVEKITKHRQQNFNVFCELMQKYDKPENRHYRFENIYQLSNDTKRTISSFALPVLVTHIEDCINALKRANIECRPLIAGNINEHPVARNNIILNSLYSKSALSIHNHGMYLPNHTAITTDDVEYMVNVVKDYI